MSTNLYLTVGSSGAIWNGRPNVADSDPELYREYDGEGHEAYQIASSSLRADGSYDSSFTAAVVNVAGQILTSLRTGSDLSTWSVSYTASDSLFGINWIPSYGFVAVGANNLVVRTDDGTTWTESQGATPGATWLWTAYGNDKIVAVGRAPVPDPDNPGSSIDQGALMYSTDNGETWTAGNPGTKNILQSIAYSPELNTFVAVGVNGTIVSVKG